LIGWVGGATIAFVIVGLSGFLLVKKRRINESSLRRLSNSEFQQWVFKRIDSKPATAKDIAIGIDGFQGSINL
jgi:hypothetical protein